jgi:hypothetical protein
MPSASLIAAIDRLDRAVFLAEAQAEAHLHAVRDASTDKTHVLRAAIADVDTLIDSLRADPAADTSSDNG